MEDESLADFDVRMTAIRHRSSHAVSQMHADVARIQAGAADHETEDEATPCDVRDDPDLQAWADHLGYRHGYSSRPLRFADFRAIMRREWDVPGLDPKYYESYYVGGHMRGERAATAQADYALGHGETRGPVAPFVREDER